MLSELISIVKTLAAGESAGTCLNAKSCTILSQYIKSLETQTPSSLNVELEQALGAWDVANLEYHKAFQMPVDFIQAATSIALENAIGRETQTRVRVLEVYRKIQKAAQDREHVLNPQGMGNE
jgi:hypothetical protein